jgi:hypothetical protein
MKKLFFLFAIAFCGCEQKPDGVIDGKPYELRSRCVESHTELRHQYRYNPSTGEMEWRLYPEFVCDSSTIDTVFIKKLK